MDATAQLKALFEEEPQLEFEFPQVFVQPKIDSFRQGKSDIAKLLRIIENGHKAKNGDKFTRAYNELLVEFRPAIDWAKLSWDYLLTTQGIRYLSRPEGEKMYCHGDYRAFTDRDFHRFIHKIFRDCVFSYLEMQRKRCNFAFYIKKNFWNRIVEDYKILENPPDPLQRKLTLYSYLRCVPYEFLNRYHQEIVDSILVKLNIDEQEIVDMYFLRFFKEGEILKRKKITSDTFYKVKEEILGKISFLDPLVHALLLQIERY